MAGTYGLYPPWRDNFYREVKAFWEVDCMYMYVYVDMCMCTCMYKNVHVYVYVYVFVYGLSAINGFKT